jgi:peptide/nickel transport system permease protein
VIRHIAARSLNSLILLVLAVIAVFLVVRILPGDPVTAMTGEFPIPADYAQQIRTSYGLDQPLPNQLILYMAAVVRGDLGYSFKNQRSVAELLAQRSVNTLLLGGCALLLATVGGLVLGVIAAAYRSRGVDKLIRLFAAGCYAAPVFWVGQLLILLLAVHLQLLPVAGMTNVRGVGSGAEYVLDLLRHLLLPAFVLALPSTAIHTRILRVAMIDALQADYVRTARAKGLAERTVMLRHALRNALLPLVTIIGLELPRLVAGAVLVETVFAWPGLGRLLFDSISSRDYPVIEAMLLIVTVAVIGANWLADISYTRLDPRIGRV